MAFGKYQRLRRSLVWLTVGGIALSIAYITGCAGTKAYENSPQYSEGKFTNDVVIKGMSFSDGVSSFWKFIFDKPADTVPDKVIPVQALTTEQLLAAPDNTIYRLGHSTILLKLAGEFWMTDPVFSDRASPVQWAGPKRFHQPPISMDELPPIKGVVISHDHYDHLDKHAVRALADKVEQFYTPLGVGDLMIEWGVPVEKVVQMDWWQSVNVAGVRLSATPAQHFSGRGLADGNQRLWASWVFEAQDYKVFFSGDTGYFDGFKEIGNRFGGFDLTLVETGAYNKAWSQVHMMPEESLQAHIDLKGKRMLPIHNGTFDLSLHSWYDPFEQIETLAAAQSVELVTPEMGEAVSLSQPQQTASWWRKLIDIPVQIAAE